ncbi:hypothetical protein [Roseateles toxinivorans]|uniref:Uncharacterized protein n=1 Tax=Roseateles toxinivorans TaxID=270368 RepID=A0A4R6QIE4_9BURK|nr:hypothetical protein [Roseateles toxinivorans]TDP62590.1 hypothetical protein DES47_107168 [Roseateles toxinivorans]
MATTISGRCMFVWRLAPILKTELGIAGMVAKAKAAGLSGVWIKIADGAKAYENVRDETAIRTFMKVRDALKNEGISVWGWQVPYGGTVANATTEAECAAKLADALKLDGVLMDAEGGTGYFTGGSAVAEAYAARLADHLSQQKRGLAICGNDIPANFPKYPFSTFVGHAQMNAPQVYYGGSPSVANRLDRAIAANASFDSPLLPVGGNSPTNTVLD